MWRPPDDLPHLHAPDATPHPLRVLGVRERTTHVGFAGVRETYDKETKEREKTMPIIIAVDEEIFVQDEWISLKSAPIRFRAVWPTGLSTKDYGDLTGQTCVYKWPGIYEIKDGRKIRLQDGEHTKPDPRLSEERRIPKPPMMHEYRNGKWRP